VKIRVDRASRCDIRYRIVKVEKRCDVGIREIGEKREMAEMVASAAQLWRVSVAPKTTWARLAFGSACNLGTTWLRLRHQQVCGASRQTRLHFVSAPRTDLRQPAVAKAMADKARHDSFQERTRRRAGSARPTRDQGSRENMLSAKRSQFSGVGVNVDPIVLQRVRWPTGSVCHLASFYRRWLRLGVSEPIAGLFGG
jgi:hypothetical protein